MNLHATSPLQLTSMHITAFTLHILSPLRSLQCKSNHMIHTSHPAIPSDSHPNLVESTGVSNHVTSDPLPRHAKEPTITPCFCDILHPSPEFSLPFREDVPRSSGYPKRTRTHDCITPIGATIRHLDALQILQVLFAAAFAPVRYRFGVRARTVVQRLLRMKRVE